MNNNETANPEAEFAIHEWMQATLEFQQNYYQLEAAIERCQTPSLKLAKAQSEKLKKLNDLQDNMGDVLVTLLVDFDTPLLASAQKGAKHEQLLLHARVIRDINQQVMNELPWLTNNTVATA